MSEYCFLAKEVFTARKRSLGQGNVFTGICLSTGAGGGGFPESEVT